jgi:Ricin-type beta-trefoil lectin domain-like
MNIKFPRRIAAVIVTGATVLSVGVSAGAAHAASADIVTPGNTPYWIAASNTGMPISVADAATWSGARIIQWYNDGGAEQEWYFDNITNSDDEYVGFLLRNVNSGLCIDTDGNAGDTLVQASCNPADNGQIFNDQFYQDALGFPEGWGFTNLGTGLELDVSGASTSEGANIDLWYTNYGINQRFTVTQAS